MQQRRKTLHVSMCENLMSEAELTVTEKAVSAGEAKLRSEAKLTAAEKAIGKLQSAGDARWEEVTGAVEAAVEEGRALMGIQEARSADDFNDDSEYSKMLHDAVQVRALPLPAWLVEAKADIDATSKTEPRCWCWLCGMVSALGLAQVELGADSGRSFTCK